MILKVNLFHYLFCKYTSILFSAVDYFIIHTKVYIKKISRAYLNKEISSITP